MAIYCGGGVTAEQLCAHVAERFNLQVAPSFRVRPRAALRQGWRFCRTRPTYSRHGTCWLAVRLATAQSLSRQHNAPFPHPMPPHAQPTTTTHPHTPPQVVPLPSRDCLLPGRYPRFTMAAQAAASVRVAWQGLRQLLPETFVDTTGWAFPYPLVRLAGARVAAYVHYPTISTDMLQRWGGGCGAGNQGRGGNVGMPSLSHSSKRSAACAPSAHRSCAASHRQ